MRFSRFLQFQRYRNLFVARLSRIKFLDLINHLHNSFLVFPSFEVNPPVVCQVKFHKICNFKFREIVSGVHNGSTTTVQAQHDRRCWRSTIFVENAVFIAYFSLSDLFTKKISLWSTRHGPKQFAINSQFSQHS